MVSNEKDQEIETEQEQPVNIRKQVPSVDNRSNRKSMFEQSTTINNTHPAERVNTTLFLYNKENFHFFL